MHSLHIPADPRHLENRKLIDSDQNDQRFRIWSRQRGLSRTQDFPTDFYIFLGALSPLPEVKYEQLKLKL